MTKDVIIRITSILTIIGFLAFLICGLTTMIFRTEQTYSYYENRNLAVMPELNKEDLGNGRYFTGIEDYLRDHAFGRNTLVRIKTWTDLFCLHRLVVNKVVVTDDVLLPYQEQEIVDPVAIQTAADAEAAILASHNAQVESYGGKFYYIAVPCQYVCKADDYPWYLNNRQEYTAASSAALFGSLDAESVPYIDMLSWYENAGRPDYFTSTVDNHYNIWGGYQVYRELLERIIKDTDWDLDILEEDDITETELPNAYLGSRGRQLMDLCIQQERLSIIEPKIDVPFERQNYGGPVESSVYKLPNTKEENILYSLYMGGDISNTVISTHRDQLPSILIYGDSFTNVVECIAWYSFDNMYSLDLRYYQDATLEEFIEEYKPEIVVCIRDYEAMLAAVGNGL